MATLTFHHTESDASLSATNDGGSSNPLLEDGPMLDSGIKLPEDAELFPVELSVLRPTQLAVGMQQVGVKASKVRRKAGKGAAVLDAWLQDNPVPVVVGPGQSLWLIDHHHLSRALHDCGVGGCYAGVARDLSSLAEEDFWREMASAGCLWPHSHEGERIDDAEARMPSLLPLTIADLRDDPYRSLAALARKAGAYKKSSRPFSEFMWANFLRPRVPLALQRPDDVVHFVGRAIAHATSEAARHLPGWTPVAQLDAAALDLMADGLGGSVDDGGGGGDGDGDNGGGGGKKAKAKKKKEQQQQQQQQQKDGEGDSRDDEEQAPKQVVNEQQQDEAC